MQTQLYPLKFHPIFQDRIWGGDKLKTVLNKEISSNSVGESWEISAVNGNQSIVKEGALKGASLQELVSNYGKDLIGKKIAQQFGDTFPLLIKFLDARQDLSIQLHPNDALAKERHNSFGKTEMWYVLQADDDAELIVGFKEGISKKDYLEALQEGTLPAVMNSVKVTEGDTFFIEVGRVHAIGAGCMIAEIQQTSDITYRVYDWDRVDADGNSRELHTELALDAINFDMEADCKAKYTRNLNNANELVSCDYFTTSLIPLNGTLEVENTFDSFMIYMCTKGDAQLTSDGGNVVISEGETLLVPACIDQFTLIGTDCELLQVYV